jgi:hypothetical protein
MAKFQSNTRKSLLVRLAEMPALHAEEATQDERGALGWSETKNWAKSRDGINPSGAPTETVFSRAIPTGYATPEIRSIALAQQELSS